MKKIILLFAMLSTIASIPFVFFYMAALEKENRFAIYGDLGIYSFIHIVVLCLMFILMMTWIDK